MILYDSVLISGQFDWNLLVSGKVIFNKNVYFDGVFDKSQNEWFLNGSFYFKNNYRFTGEWKNGFI